MSNPKCSNLKKCGRGHYGICQMFLKFSHSLDLNIAAVAFVLEIVSLDRYSFAVPSVFNQGLG